MSREPSPLKNASGSLALSWSGGKDSAMTLHTLQGQGADVRTLLTTVTKDVDRISMHGVRRDLLQAQASALGIPVHEVEIPLAADNASYQEAMSGALQALRGEGISAVAFGDLYLEDVRRYREEQMAGTGLQVLFPVWGRDTRTFYQEVIDLGFRAVIVCVDTTQIGPEFAGRELDAALLAELPASADPCGENGEFHTFVYDGPGFREPVSVERGQQVLRDGRFLYQDLF